LLQELFFFPYYILRTEYVKYFIDTHRGYAKMLLYKGFSCKAIKTQLFLIFHRQRHIVSQKICYAIYIMSCGPESSSSPFEQSRSMMYIMNGGIGEILHHMSTIDRETVIAHPSSLLSHVETSQEEDPHKREQYKRFQDTIITLGKYATHKTGTGTTNDFFMLPASLEHPFSAMGIGSSIGIRRTRTEPLTLPDGTPYEGIRLDDPDRPEPIRFFLDGAILQSIDAQKSRLAFGVSRVPEVYAVVMVKGVIDSRTGKVVAGSEDIITELYAVMEAISGKSIFQICDPDRHFTAGRYSARKKESIHSFLKNEEVYIRASIRTEASQNPAMLSWDFDHIRTQVQENISVAGDVSVGGVGILGNDAHPGNMLISSDGEAVHPIDRDMARMFTDASFLQYPENYRYEEKSSENDPQIFLPDDTSRITDEHWERYWKPRFGERGDLLDAITLAGLFINIIEDECTHMRHEQQIAA